MEDVGLFSIFNLYRKSACKGIVPALAIPSIHRFLDNLDSRQLERYPVKITMEQQRINGSICRRG